MVRWTQHSSVSQVKQKRQELFVCLRISSIILTGFIGVVSLGYSIKYQSQAHSGPRYPSFGTVQLLQQKSVCGEFMAIFSLLSVVGLEVYYVAYLWVRFVSCVIIGSKDMPISCYYSRYQIVTTSMTYLMDAISPCIVLDVFFRLCSRVFTTHLFTLRLNS